MKYLALMFLLLSFTVYATDNSTSNQTNTSGSNTTISGGYTSTTTNNNDGHFTDENCERMKLGKLLYDFNMRVAAIAILCQDDRIFSAMHHAGTPCPFEGQIGAAAKAQWKKYDVERPDYHEYTKNLRRRRAIDARLNKVLEKRVNTEFELYGDDKDEE